MEGLELIAVPGIPAIAPGDDLVGVLCDAVAASEIALRDADVVVIAQKIVSKADGRYVELGAVMPTPAAEALAAETGKDPRLVEVILGESARILRHRPGLIIAIHRTGLVLANAGVDVSNVRQGSGEERVLLLPERPDARAEEIRRAIAERLGVRVGVVISDSAGRAWRMGVVGYALGAAGVPALVDLRGKHDLFARPLESTAIGLADEIAAAAALLQGEAREGRPVIIVRGLALDAPACGAQALVRPPADDLFLS